MTFLLFKKEDSIWSQILSCFVFHTYEINYLFEINNLFFVIYFCNFQVFILSLLRLINATESSISYQQYMEVACSPLTVSCHSDIAAAENILSVTLLESKNWNFAIIQSMQKGSILHREIHGDRIDLPHLRHVGYILCIVFNKFL